MSRVPSEETCLEILREEGCSKRVITHCRTVKELAVKITGFVDADPDLVVAGALLHDLGRCRSHRIDHAVQGMRAARERGLPESVVEIVKRHIGAGMTPDEAAEMGLPRDDYFPRTLEEKVVAHADNLTVDDHYEGHDRVVKKYLRKDLPEQADRVEALHVELSHICGTDLDTLALDLQREREMLAGTENDDQQGSRL